MGAHALMTDASDTQLLELWAAGDAQAGQQLFQRHFPTVRRFFRNKVGSEIEDLVQQTFLACVAAQAAYRRDSSFKTFLLAIARNQLFKHYRNMSRRPDLDFGASSVRDLGTSPTGEIARRQDERALALALQSVPLDMQIAVELAYWEELDPGEIAAVLEIPVNTVYSRLRRARLLLREILAIAPEAPGPVALLDDLDAWSQRMRVEGSR
jgi:RNA polymerase sigma-70 factor (ECF subfamily)